MRGEYCIHNNYGVTLELVGAGTRVPLVTGGDVPYADLDCAASTPALVEVRDAVHSLLDWYSSVHRGAGFKSVVSTAAYEGARSAVRSFLGARPDDAVVFTRNTTDAMNLLAHALPEGCEVVAFETEHHANLLPWRRRPVTFLPPPHSAEAALDALSAALAGRATGERVVTIPGASNVTGELWPVREIVELAHAHGARVVLDAAQLAPHAPVDMAGTGVDYVAFSGHKLYAPFGAGVLAGRGDWLAGAEPLLAGGGAVELVTTSEVVWTGLPDRHEAGSPNVVGAVALAVACRALEAAGMPFVAEREAALAHELVEGLRAIPGVELYTLWDPAEPRIGVVTFNLAGYHHGLLATVLSAEHGIGVRHGCFCAHPLVLHLLRVDARDAARLQDGVRAGRATLLPGAVRASLGVGSTPGDVRRLVEAVADIARRGPRWCYEPGGHRDEFRPVPDPRPLPDLPFPLAVAAREAP